MKRFGLIGAAGFIAPRHMRAIKDTGNVLAVAVDKHDCVGVMDQYFPESDFFTEFERFDRHVDKLRRAQKPLDYITVCSPNYLHDAHIRFALRNGVNCVCEKPVVLNPRNLPPLFDIERETGKKAATILQLRLHPVIQNLKKQVSEEKANRKYDIDLTYVTMRGRWYDHSWKGEVDKSGGVATNIGVHFFDMLGHVFGQCQHNVVHLLEPRRAAGYLEFAKARVRWFLSLDARDLPNEVRAQNKTTFRSLTIDGKSLEFSEGFTDLHTRSYEHILQSGGFGLEEALPSIEIVSTIRHSVPVGFKGDYHEMLRESRGTTIVTVSEPRFQELKERIEQPKASPKVSEDDLLVQDPSEMGPVS